MVSALVDSLGALTKAGDSSPSKNLHLINQMKIAANTVPTTSPDRSKAVLKSSNTTDAARFRREEGSDHGPQISSMANWQGNYPVMLEVSEHHINRMDYYFNDSPMCNQITQNAVALAIRELVHEGCRVEVRVINGKAIARIGEEDCPLGAEIGSWLSHFMEGGTPKPFRQTVQVPMKTLLLSTPMLSVFCTLGEPAE